MFAVPGVAAPVTTPVVAPTVAVPGVDELQLPPEVASASVTVVPGHKYMVPVIAAGNGLITTVWLPVIVLWHNVDVLVPITV